MKYMLHIWKDGKGQAAWRARLQELRSQQVHYFSKPDALIAFLEQQTEAQPQ